MAKYVGKIFEVNNCALKIRGNGTHKVHIQWYNPFKHIFRCKVITSLENKMMNLSDLEGGQIKNTFIKKRSDNCFYVFDKGKYERLRNGDIVPIPMSKAKGLEVWSGYEDTKYLRVNILKKSIERQDCVIKKK